jgi:hypothetical protein
MSSNSPSGGMKEMVRSFSNRDSRTHWWNLTSSISMALPRDARISSAGPLLTSTGRLEHDFVI